MNTDKAQIKSLKERVANLEKEIADHTNEIASYKLAENKADEKIKAINMIHADKIRSLMNSINLLKKENAQMKKLSQEHKRSELINNLNKDIGDQEIIIDVLKRMVGNDAQADKAIVEALSKGPPRVRPLSREELRAEIKRLNIQIDKLKNNNGMSKSDVSKHEEKKGNEDDDDELDLDTEGESKEELIGRNNELANLLEDVRLELKVKEQRILAQEDLLRKKNEEISELNSVKSEAVFLNKKYNALQDEYMKFIEEINKKNLMNYDKDLKLQEVEMLYNQKDKKISALQNTAKTEMESLGLKILEYEQRMQDMKIEYDRMRTKIAESLKRNEALQKELLQTRGEAEDTKRQIELLHDQIAAHEEKRGALEDKLQVLEKGKASAQMRIVELDEKIEALEKIKDEVEGLRDEVDYWKSKAEDLKNQRPPTPQETPRSVTRVREAEPGELEAAILENEELRGRFKELKQAEIELKDRIEILQQENNYSQKRISALLIIQKRLERSAAAVGFPGVEGKGRDEIISNYEKQLSDLRLKLNEAERRASEMEELAKINNTIFDEDISQIEEKSILDELGKSRGPMGRSLLTQGNDLMSENAELRVALKELKKREIELQDQVDILKQEKDYLENRAKAQNQLNKKIDAKK